MKFVTSSVDTKFTSLILWWR